MGDAAEIQSDYLGVLNPAQRQAASYGQVNSSGGFAAGPLLVIAGAGTGKSGTDSFAHVHPSGRPGNDAASRVHCAQGAARG